MSRPKRFLVDGVPSNNPEGFKFKVTLPNGQEEILYDPHPKQLEFHRRTEPNVLFYGGRGSGKSLALRMEAHARALSTPNFVYCILRKTFPELRQSHLKATLLPREMKLLGGEFNKTEKIAYYPNGSMGFFTHCETEEDAMNLLSAEYAWMGFDELSTFSWDVFTKLYSAVRTTDDDFVGMVRAATNPLGPSAEEINRYFVDKDIDFSENPDYIPGDWHAIQANLEDNPSVNADAYLRRLTQGLPDHVRKAWVDGEFALENSLFDVKPTKTIEVDGQKKTIPYHIVQAGDIDLKSIVKYGQIYRAIDNGWFPDPTYVLWIAHLGNRIVAFNEITRYRTVATDVVDMIKAEDERLGITRVANTYCDPTMALNTTADVRTLKDIYESKGIPLECSINNREMYASHIHLALGTEASPNVPKLQIYAPGCPYLAKSLPRQRYDIKHPLQLANHSDDHPAVTLAYFLISSGALDRQSFGALSSVKRWMKPKGGTGRWTLGSESVR